MGKLRECPFCGSSEVGINKCYANWGYGYRVTCKRCLGAGSAGLSDRINGGNDAMKRYAIANWNRRHSPKPEALTLEQLKLHDGAVWLVCERWKGWAFPFYSELDGCVFFNCHGHDTIRRNVEGYDSDTMWNFLCYTTKPETEEDSNG